VCDACFANLSPAVQVANVLRARSADGLSPLSFELESWGLLVHTAYGYLKGLPFSAYGEAGVLFAQNVLLLALIYTYARMPVSRALATAVVAVSAVVGVATGECRPQACSSDMWHLSGRGLLQPALPMPCWS